jgi:Pyruvate/2-oxoacid:ferredoxin oxidoreductase delta subunit
VQQDKPLLFGGDLTNQDLSVTHAIASGKQAAMALDIFFQTGWDSIEKGFAGCNVGCGSSLSMEVYLNGDRKGRSRQVVPFSEINVDYFPSHHRVQAPHLSPDKRVDSFVEIESTLSSISAEEETARCFNCGICNVCGNCRLYCPEMAVILEDAKKIDLDYCKGCGVCVVECPRSAMTLVEENV